MIERDLAAIAEMLGHEITLSNGRIIIPGEDEYERILDKAAGDLYNERVGARMNVTHLIVEKRPNNMHGVYIYVGDYQ